MKAKHKWSPANGYILDADEEIPNSERCPFCMKKLIGTKPENLVSIPIDRLGSSGAHLSCVRKEQ